MTAVTKRILKNVVDSYPWDVRDHEDRNMIVDQAEEFTVRVPHPPVPSGGAVLRGFRIDTGRRLVESVNARSLSEAVRQYRKYGTASELFALAEFHSEAVGSFEYVCRFDPESETWGAWESA